MNVKRDPISDKYFKPVEKAEAASEWLFYATAIVSLVVLFIDKTDHPTIYTVVQIVFGIFAVAGFLLGLATKLYWAPRGAEKRIADFVSAAFAVNLTSERTEGYYNNAATVPIRKAAFQLLENSFFTKEIARLMCFRRRAVVAAYILAWLAVIAYRDISVDFVMVALQVVFSEEIISSVIRLEWLRAKTERIFDVMYRHLSTSTETGTAFAACVVEHLVRYESDKATSNVTLSSAVFHANNARHKTNLLNKITINNHIQKITS